MRSVLTLVVVAALGLVGCGGSSSDGATDCPDGTALQETAGGLPQGDAVETRDAAVELELEHLGADASDDAVTAGIVASVLAAEGVEQVVIESADGAITMLLAPQMPGWRVERSTRCAPAT